VRRINIRTRLYCGINCDDAILFFGDNSKLYYTPADHINACNIDGLSAVTVDGGYAKIKSHQYWKLSTIKTHQAAYSTKMKQGKGCNINIGSIYFERGLENMFPVLGEIEAREGGIFLILETIDHVHTFTNKSSSELF
jgi:hypothetical protein